MAAMRCVHLILNSLPPGCDLSLAFGTKNSMGAGIVHVAHGRVRESCNVLIIIAVGVEPQEVTSFVERNAFKETVVTVSFPVEAVDLRAMIERCGRPGYIVVDECLVGHIDVGMLSATTSFVTPVLRER